MFASYWTEVRQFHDILYMDCGMHLHNNLQLYRSASAASSMGSGSENPISLIFEHFRRLHDKYEGRRIEDSERYIRRVQARSSYR